MNDKNPSKIAWLKQTDLMVAVGVLGTLLVMIIPMPAVVMDMLLVGSICLSIIILLVSVYSGRPLEFSVFPTILLFATLFRLSLNVASTRLILLNGHQGESAAGHVIQTFGNFVVGGNYVVGLVVFILLIVINFVVITKGSGRVAEVAARFILDAMPGKQMSIDADLNAGLINETQALERRNKIEQEADFYGAMDGASKFVRGDAIAGIIITVINIIGGLLIGIFQKGLDLSKAAEIYTLMTVGDGLVSQIPSLIISTAAGIVVTRAASGNNLSQEVTKQLFFQSRALGATAGILALMAFMPGLPTIPFLFSAILCGAISYGVTQKEKKETQEKKEKERKELETQAAETNVPPEVDTLELQVGYGIVNLVEGSGKSELIERIYQIRKEFAKELGIIVPKVRIKDNLELQPAQYSILIKGVSVGGGEILSGYLLAMDPGTVTEAIAGIETTEPVFGLSAIWIREADREKAQMAGYTVVDASTIIATHLSEIIRRNSQELIGRQELQTLIDNLAKSTPKVVEEAIGTNAFNLGAVLKVCKGLLKEQVPIRDLRTVLETLANYASTTKDTDQLVEYVRTALARTITNRLTNGTGSLEVMTMAPSTEEQVIRAYQRQDNGSPTLNLDPSYFEKLIKALNSALETTVFNSGTPVLLCRPMIRGLLKRAVERFVPNLQIISANDISPDASVKIIASVEA